MRCRYEETRFRNENDGYCVLCYSTEDPEVPEGARNKYRGEDRFIFTAVGTELPAKKDQEVDPLQKSDLRQKKESVPICLPE